VAREGGGAVRFLERFTDVIAGMTDGEPTGSQEDDDSGGRLANAAEFVVDLWEFVLGLF